MKALKKESEHVLILHNIRSAHNVGSILRTADAVGIFLVILTGYSPAPTDRFGRNNKDIAKTALGAEKKVPWKISKRLSSPIKALKAEGYEIVGIEQDRRATDYKKFKPIKLTAFVFGNEVGGLSAGAKKLCDFLIEIPMRGTKESLNVSVAAGVALFRALDQ